ncbi:MAG: pentapeptide repeat-containing protein [Candidatus Nanopelagicales bacterium]|nr:pentapeptide repeat-containing protein [Candidatus Nanopelagicales bacterium]
MSAAEIDPPIEESASGFRPPRISIRRIGTCPVVLFDNRNRGRVSCPGLDMRGGSLRGLNLEGANLRGANLAGVDFPSAVTNADLSGANLTGAIIRDTAFNGTDFSGATWIDGRVCAEGSRGVCR